MSSLGTLLSSESDLLPTTVITTPSNVFSSTLCNHFSKFLNEVSLWVRNWRTYDVRSKTAMITALFLKYVFVILMKSSWPALRSAKLSYSIPNLDFYFISFYSIFFGNKCKSYRRKMLNINLLALKSSYNGTFANS